MFDYRCVRVLFRWRSVSGWGLSWFSLCCASSLFPSDHFGFYCSACILLLGSVLGGLVPLMSVPILIVFWFLCLLFSFTFLCLVFTDFFLLLCLIPSFPRVCSPVRTLLCVPASLSLPSCFWFMILLNVLGFCTSWIQFSCALFSQTVIKSTLWVFILVGSTTTRYRTGWKEKRTPPTPLKKTWSQLETDSVLCSVTFSLCVIMMELLLGGGRRCVLFRTVLSCFGLACLAACFQ